MIKYNKNPVEILPGFRSGQFFQTDIFCHISSKILLFFCGCRFGSRGLRSFTKDRNMEISFFLFSFFKPGSYFFFFRFYEVLILLISLLLLKHSLSDTPKQVSSVQHSLKFQNRPDRIGGQCPIVQPFQCLVGIQVNGGWRSHRVVSTNLFNKLTITWCSDISRHYVIKWFFLAAFSLQS